MLQIVIFCGILRLANAFNGGGPLSQTSPYFRMERAPQSVANMAVSAKFSKNRVRDSTKFNPSKALIQRLNDLPSTESAPVDLPGVLRILRSVKPSERQLLDLLISLKESNNLEMSLALEAVQNEVAPLQTVHYNVLISSCKKSRRWREALRLLQRMRMKDVKRDTVSYNALLDVLDKSGRWKLALKTMQQMRKDDVSPNTITFSTAISACSRSGEWWRALKLLRWMQECEVPVNTIAYSSCVTACQRAGQWERALQLLTKMEAEDIEADIVTLNAAMSACASAGQWQEAKRLFDSEMPRHGLKPDAFSYNTLIIAYANVMPTAEWEKALQVLDAMREAGFSPNVVSYNSVLVALRRGCQLPKVLEVLDHMEFSGGEIAPDIISYTEAIGACVEGASWETAQLLLRRMQDAQVQPSAFTYSRVMASLLNGEKFRECLDMFQTVSNEGLRHHVQTLNLMLEAAHKGGYVEEGLALALPVLNEFQARQAKYPANRETLEYLKRLLEVAATQDGFASHLSAESGLLLSRNYSSASHLSAIQQQVNAAENREFSRLQTEAEVNAQLDAED